MDEARKVLLALRGYGRMEDCDGEVAEIQQAAESTRGQAAPSILQASQPGALLVAVLRGAALLLAEPHTHPRSTVAPSSLIHPRQPPPTDLPMTSRAYRVSHRRALQVFRDPTLRWPIVIMIVLQVAQQLSGINAVFFYSSSFFTQAGVSNPNYGTLATGAW